MTYSFVALPGLVALLAFVFLFAPPGAYSQSVGSTVDQSEPELAVEAGLGKLVLSRLASLADQHQQSTGVQDRRKKSQFQRYPEMAPEEGSDMNQEREQQAILKQKFIMKKRLHKLLEDILEEENSPSQRSNEASTRKRSSASEEDDSNEKIMIFVKKPRKKTSHKAGLLSKDEPEPEPDHERHPAQARPDRVSSMDQWDILAQRSREPKLTSASSTADRSLGPLNQGNVNEHARRIMDDRFGIIKESVFSTNNHLGLKGVPKFGSDEEY